MIVLDSEVRVRSERPQNTERTSEGEPRTQSQIDEHVQGPPEAAGRQSRCHEEPGGQDRRQLETGTAYGKCQSASSRLKKINFINHLNTFPHNKFHKINSTNKLQKMIISSLF